MQALPGLSREADELADTDKTCWDLDDGCKPDSASHGWTLIDKESASHPNRPCFEFGPWRVATGMCRHEMDGWMIDF